MIDLHIHTTSSDGSLSFEQLVAEAKRVGLKAIAITDHDNVQSARKITGKEPIEVVPGVELSVFDHAMGYEDVHMLGLFIDPEDKTLNSKLAALIQQREEQKRETVKKINELGYAITFEEAKALAAWGLGRPHIARLLVKKYPKDFPTTQDAFDKLLGNGKPAYVIRKNGFGLGEAVSLIKAAGGISVLAHPLLYKYDLDKLISDFKRLGGMAMETYYDYATNTPRRGNDIKELGSLNQSAKTLTDRYALPKALADRYGLLESGGSDFHGAEKGQKLGIFTVPDEILQALKQARGKAL